jgi:hypothetical protein
MFKQTSQEFRKLFLTKFTNELIRNSETIEAFAIRQKLREKIKENIEKKEDERKLQHMLEKREIVEELEQLPLKEKIRNKTRTIPQRLRLIKDKIPETIRNILPAPTNAELDLGKLNPFITDPTVIMIECAGPNTYVSVKRIRGETRMTNVKLTKEEIDKIVKIFSKATKVPTEEGIFKAAFGKLIISATVSEIIDSNFLITKMNPFHNYN